MTVSPPSIAVFDVGRVLIEWDRMALYRRLLGSDAAASEFLATVCTEAWNLQFDLGVPYAENIATLVAEFPEHESLIRAYDEKWMEMVPDAIHGTVAILQELKRRGIPLYAITNFSAEKFALVQERFAWFGLFIDIVVSGEERIIKPDPAIYRLLLDRNALEAGDTIFIDDSPTNVEGARAIGMHAVQFTGPERLEADLRGVGLL